MTKKEISRRRARQSTSSSRRTFEDILLRRKEESSTGNPESERELLRLMAHELDVDDALYQLGLLYSGREYPVFEAAVYELFGKLVEMPKTPKEHELASQLVLRRYQCLQCECVDVYELSLQGEHADPALEADRHLVEEMIAATHPDMREGEFFLGNIDTSSFHILTWKTKRLGKVAYSDTGTPLVGYRPLFVSKEEVFEAGLPT